jgi:hypothetical protein
MRSACCARAANGHVAADPVIPVMKSRRRIGFPKTHDRVSTSSQRKRSNQKFAPSEMGSMVCLRSSNLAPRMSVEAQQLP